MTKFFKFLYNFVLIDSYTKKVSHSKFWSNIGCSLMCFLFTYSVMDGTAGVEIWVVFGAFVMGNNTAHRILNYKYGNRAGQQEEAPDGGNPQH